MPSSGVSSPNLPAGHDGVMELQSAVEGTRYRVIWDDCCAGGSFEAVLTRKNYVPDPPEPEPFLENVTFDNGVTISGHGVVLEETEG